jgi:hypothetical protein
MIEAPLLPPRKRRGLFLLFKGLIKGDLLKLGHCRMDDDIKRWITSIAIYSLSVLRTYVSAHGWVEKLDRSPIPQYPCSKYESMSITQHKSSEREKGLK